MRKIDFKQVREEFDTYIGNIGELCLDDETLAQSGEVIFRIADGVTPGGLPVPGMGGDTTPSVYGSFDTLPDFLDFTANTQLETGQNSQGIFFSGDAGNNAISYPIRTNFAINGTTKVVVTVDMMVNDFCTDFGLCVFEAGVEPKWKWGPSLTRLAASYNCPTPYLYGKDGENESEFGLPGVGTYKVRFTYDPNNTPNLMLETLDTSDNVLDTITLNETLDTSYYYRIGFGADQDNDFGDPPTNYRTYMKNLTIAIDGGETYTNSLVLPDSLDNVQSNVSFTQSDAGRIASVLGPNDAWFDRVVTDGDGNTYAAGGSRMQYQDDISTIYKFNSAGDLVWKNKLIFNNDENNTPYITGMRWIEGYLWITGYYWWPRYGELGVDGDDYGFVMRIDSGGGWSDPKWLHADRPDGDLYPYDVDILSDGSIVVTGTFKGGGVPAVDVTPVGGQYNTVWLSLNDLYVTPEIPANVDPYGDGNILWGPVCDTAGDNFYGFKIFDLPAETVTGSGSGARFNIILAFITDINGHFVPTGSVYQINSTTWYTRGTGYKNGDTLKILGTYLGGTSPENDITFTVYADNNREGVVSGTVWNSWQGVIPADKIPFTTWRDIDFSNAIGNSNYTFGYYTDYDVFVATVPSLNETSNWQVHYKGPSTNSDYAHSMAVIKGGNSGDLTNDKVITLAQHYDNIAGEWRSVADIVDGTGTQISQLVIDNGSSGEYGPGFVVTDNSNNVYFSQVDYDQSDENNALSVIKMNSNLTIEWRSRQLSSDYNWDNNPSITVGPDGNLYLAGAWYDGGIGQQGLHIIKMNAEDGTLIWDKSINSMHYDPYTWYYDVGIGIAVDTDWVYVTFNRYNPTYGRDEAYMVSIPNNSEPLNGFFFTDDNSWYGAPGNMMFSQGAFSPVAYTAGTSDVNPYIVEEGNTYSIQFPVTEDVKFKNDKLWTTDYGIEDVNHIAFKDGSVLTSAIPNSTISEWENPETENNWRIDTWSSGWSGYVNNQYYQEVTGNVAVGGTNISNITITLTPNELNMLANPSKNNIDESTYNLSFDDGVTWYPVGYYFDIRDEEGVVALELMDFPWGNNYYVTVASGVPVKLRYKFGRPKVWFDVGRSPGGTRHFRGAKIDFHAYIQGRGTVIGTVHIANDTWDQEVVTHTEVASGHEYIGQIDFYVRRSWWDDGCALWVKRNDGYDGPISVQWTSTLFYGNDYWGD